MQENKQSCVPLTRNPFMRSDITLPIGSPISPSQDPFPDFAFTSPDLFDITPPPTEETESSAPPCDPTAVKCSALRRFFSKAFGRTKPITPSLCVSNIPSSPARDSEAVALNIRPQLTKCGAGGEVISTTSTRSRARDLSTCSSSSHASAANLLAREQQALGEYKALQRDEDSNMFESLDQSPTQSCRASLPTKISEHTCVRVAHVKPPDASAPGSKVGRWIKRLRAGWKA